MTTFFYNVLTKEGQEIEGVITASSKEEAKSKLHTKGYLITNLKEVHKANSLPQRIKKREITLFIAQLSGLMEGGLSLYKSLSLLSNRYRNKRIKAIIEEVSEEVKKGSSLSEAFLSHLDVFPELLINMVKAGEASGRLEETLGRYATYAQREEDLKNRLGMILTYHFFICMVTLATIFFLILFVIPRVSLIYKELEQVLPLPTRLLITSSTLLGRFWWVASVFILLFIIGANKYLKRRDARITLDRAKLKIPLLGEILNKILISRFSLTLGTLIQAGVPILDAISMARETIGNEYISSRLVDLHQGVKEGKGISTSLMEDSIFPDEFIQMVAVGEESGNLGGILLKIFDSYDREVENSLKRLAALLEPAMTIIMGLVVGFVVVAMLLPLFSIKIFIE